MQVCPMCGAWSTDALSECQGCGEPLGEQTNSDDPGLRKVRIGVSLVFFGILLVLFTIFGGLYGAYRSFRALDMDALRTLIIVAGGLYLLASGMMFVGKFMCLSVPRQVGATGIVYTSVAIDVVNVGIQVAQIGGLLKDVPVRVTLGLNAAGIVGAVLFLLFLKRVADYIGRKDLAKSATSIWSTGVLCALMIVGAFFLATNGKEVIAALIVLGAMLFILLAFINYVILLGRMRRAIAR